MILTHFVVYRCRRRKTPGDGGIVDGCGWQGLRRKRCPDCGSTLLRPTREPHLPAIARLLRIDIEQNMNNRRGLHWHSIPAESGQEVIDALRVDVEQRFLAILGRFFLPGDALSYASKRMADRTADLRLIDDVLRRSAQGTVKHHEMSLALQALERVELGRYDSAQPAPRQPEKK